MVSLYFNETKKKIELFYLHCYCKTLLSNKSGEFKSDKSGNLQSLKK